tara:strand:+ start:4391 stop:5464 length:1074 start_codon:yes stop_codon:yes gene_type:complete
MSSMLEQAIIDAEQLKETAKQTAEETVVEKYQDEIKEAIEKILEQDEVVETEMTVNNQGDLEVVEDLPSAQVTEEEEVVEIDLNKLEELMAQELEEDEMDASDMYDREHVAEELEAIAEDDEVELEESDLVDLAEEEIELDETNLAAVIAEILSEGDEEEEEEEEEVKEEDAEADLEEEKKPDFPDVDGDGDTKEALSKAAKEKKEKKEKTNESRLLKRENASLLKEQTKINNKAQLLEERLNKYGTVITKLKNKLNESNLTNAKLLYQNRILNSVSLNERQRNKIAEAISNANSVEEAKLIFETLQSAVGSFENKKTPKSLNEVVSRSSSAFIPHKEVKPQSDAFAERMKRLAGLK